MMVDLFKKVVISILIWTLVLPTIALASETPTIAASYTYFTDVKRNHYAYDAIIWAHQKEIISGYDGEFRPNNTVTEAQFAKMIAEYFKMKDNYGDLKKTTKPAHWADGYYDALAQYAVPLNGYFDNGIRNEPVKRGVVAQALAYIVDGRTNLTESIEFLLENEISTGQNPQYEYTNLEKYFGVSNNLTRAQVVTFLYRMNEKGYVALSDYIEMPNGDSINAIADFGKSLLDSRLSMTEPTYTSGLVPKQGLILTYYPSFFTDEKETFRVEEDYSCIKLVNMNRNGQDFCYHEDAHALSMGVSDTDWILFNLTYPMQQGKYVKNIEYDYEYLRERYNKVYVESTNEKMKIKAGTFYNVVVLVYENGERLYFAEDVGLIKAVDSTGNVTIELHSIKKS